MGLLEKLKSAIGLDGSGSRARSGADAPRRDVDVTVEREPENPSEPDTATEAAVKGTTDVASNDSAGTATTDAGDGSGDGDAAATTTGTTVDAAGGQSESAAVEDESDDAGSTESEAGAADVPGADRPVDSLSGIGPAYAETLADVGVETVGDLVETGAETVGAETDLSEKRVGRWIAQAREEDE